MCDLRDLPGQHHLRVAFWNLALSECPPLRLVMSYWDYVPVPIPILCGDGPLKNRAKSGNQGTERLMDSHEFVKLRVMFTSRER